MIRDIRESAPWPASIRAVPGSDISGIGLVIGRLTSGGATLFLSVSLLDGRLLRVTPDLVDPIPSAESESLAIPPVPDSAVTVCGRRS
jgi:hypothetical protein